MPEVRDTGEWRRDRGVVAVALLALGILAAFIGVWFFGRGSGEQGEPRPLTLEHDRDLSDLGWGPNVLIIVLDAVRADFLGCYSRVWSGEQSFTPVLDELAERGARFANATASGNWTRPSVASLFTGLRPMRHADWQGMATDFGQRDKGGRPLVHSLAESFDTLAEVLQRAGYTTACFAPGEHGQFHRLSGFSQGFEFYEGSYSDAKYVRSDETFEALGNWLENVATPGKPFFAYVHTLGAHKPYVPPPPYDEMYRGVFRRWAGDVPTGGEHRRFLIGEETRREFYLERYAGLVRHADHHLGVLLRRLDRLGVLDNTLLMVTADHGDALWDHGRPGHGRQLFEESIHVPLIMVGPGIEASAVNAQVELVDLYPTALDFCGVESQSRLDGRSLLALARGERNEPPRPKAVSFQRPDDVALRVDNRFKFIYTGPRTNRGRSRSRLFDLENDPTERENVIAEHAVLAFDFRLELQRSVLAQTAGWHLLFDPGVRAAEFSADVELQSALYGPFDYHCVPSQDRSGSKDWFVGACPDGGEASSTPVVVARNGHRLTIDTALENEALHVHFRPGEPGAQVTFDLRIDGVAAGIDLVSLGASAARPQSNRFELGPLSPASVGLFADTRILDGLGNRRAIYIWRVDFPPAASEPLPEETVEGLRSLGYIQ